MGAQHPTADPRAGEAQRQARQHDDQEPAEALPAFIDRVAGAGIRHFAVHARKAWLEGLSPKENRDIPPLDHDLVARVKAERPDLLISLNGGIGTLAEAREHLRRFDGVMIGRAAYNDPAGILGGADAFITGEGAHHTTFDALEAGINVLYAGHYATETVGVRALAEHVAERFGVPWVFHDHPTGL